MVKRVPDGDGVGPSAVCPSDFLQTTDSGHQFSLCQYLLMFTPCQALVHSRGIWDEQDKHSALRDLVILMGEILIIICVCTHLHTHILKRE